MPARQLAGQLAPTKGARALGGLVPVLETRGHRTCRQPRQHERPTGALSRLAGCSPAIRSRLLPACYVSRYLAITRKNRVDAGPTICATRSWSWARRSSSWGRFFRPGPTWYRPLMRRRCRPSRTRRCLFPSQFCARRSVRSFAAIPPRLTHISRKSRWRLPR